MQFSKSVSAFSSWGDQSRRYSETEYTDPQALYWLGDKVLCAKTIYGTRVGLHSRRLMVLVISFRRSKKLRFWRMICRTRFTFCDLLISRPFCVCYFQLKSADVTKALLFRVVKIPGQNDIDVSLSKKEVCVCVTIYVCVSKSHAVFNVFYRFLLFVHASLVLCVCLVFVVRPRACLCAPCVYVCVAMSIRSVVNLVVGWLPVSKKQLLWYIQHRFTLLYCTIHVDVRELESHFTLW